jgi:uncharacterized membrane protein
VVAPGELGSVVAPVVGTVVAEVVAVVVAVVLAVVAVVLTVVDVVEEPAVVDVDFTGLVVGGPVYSPT